MSVTITWIPANIKTEDLAVGRKSHFKDVIEKHIGSFPVVLNIDEHIEFIKGLAAADQETFGSLYDVLRIEKSIQLRLEY